MCLLPRVRMATLHAVIFVNKVLAGQALVRARSPAALPAALFVADQTFAD